MNVTLSAVRQGHRLLVNQTMAYHLVFVYGTLKLGEPNHHLFDAKNGDYKFLTKGTTVNKYPLIIGSKYNIPFLLYSPSNGTNVKGEIYRVDDKMLEKLDELEEHPNFYTREVKQVTRDDNKKTEDCWIYFLKKFRPELLSDPFYEEYLSTGSHGKQYCERYLRDPNEPAKAEVWKE